MVLIWIVMDFLKCSQTFLHEFGRKENVVIKWIHINTHKIYVVFFINIINN